MANSNGWGDGASNNQIGWGQGADNAIGWGDSHAKSWSGATDIVGITTDADAQAFITAAAITDPTQQTAINNLVLGMKADGIWTKMKAVYPFVGGTATAHKWNLKDPRDLDAAFRLVFNGGWTHSSNGATPNGTNGWANTYLQPSSVLTQNSTHLSFYSRSNILNTLQFEMGSFTIPSGLGSSSFGISYNTAPNGHMRNRISTSTPSTGFIPTDSRGLFTLNRTLSTQQKAYQNGVLKETANVNSDGLSILEIAIGANRTALTGGFIVGDYSAKQCAFSTIGNGLTDTEAANLYTRVQAFQTSLSRQV